MRLSVFHSAPELEGKSRSDENENENESLQAAIRASGVAEAELRDLPLTGSKTLDWVALLDGELNRMGWAPMDGF